MLTASDWRIAATRILSRRELATVLADLRRKSRRSVGSRQNLVLVRLAACVGLRVSEIAGLRLKDLITEGDRPHVSVRAETAKGGRGRIVPLWWDRGTLEDLTTWKAWRTQRGAEQDAPVICSMQRRFWGQSLSRHALRRRFRTAISALGIERADKLTIHDGRHTFISHALAGGRTLAEVRDAAGHSSISVTSVYLHIAVDDKGEVGNLFEFHE